MASISSLETLRPSSRRLDAAASLWSSSDESGAAAAPPGAWPHVDGLVRWDHQLNVGWHPAQPFLALNLKSAHTGHLTGTESLYAVSSHDRACYTLAALGAQTSQVYAYVAAAPLGDRAHRLDAARYEPRGR